MFKKGPPEFLIVILALTAAVFFAWNINCSSCNSSKKNDKVTPVKMTPEMVRWQEGRTLFRSNCASCHNPKADGTGPPLIGVTARWKTAGDYRGKPGEQWLHLWIKNWHEPVDSNYKYAVDMANSRIAQMNSFSNLSDEDINKILEYVEAPDKDKAK